MLFDVNRYRKEVFADKGCGTGIRIRLGFQPSACASGRGGAEVEQDGLQFLLPLRERRVDIFHPGNESQRDFI